MTDAPPYVGPAAHTTSGSNLPPRRIVIHATVSPCVKGGARSVAAYFRTKKATGSAHYVVDPGEAVQVVRDDVIAWHAPPNANSIGVELCDPQSGPGSRWSGDNHDAMLRRAAVLVAGLCRTYDIPVKKRSALGLRLGRKGICGHVNVSHAFRQSSHTDPGPDFPWKRFMRLVQEAYDGVEYVTMRPGETLAALADRAGIPLGRMWRLNPGTAPTVGTRVRVK